MNTQKLEQVPIDKLVPYARNARTHSKEQIAQLRASLREFGFVSPAVIDADCTKSLARRLVLSTWFYYFFQRNQFSSK